VLLPKPLTHVSSFASLNKTYLAPHDTIHAIAKSTSDFHGMVEISFASPTQSLPVADEFTVTGTGGWLSVNQTAAPDSDTSVVRVVITSNLRGDSAMVAEREEVIVEPRRGVEAEMEGFFEALKGGNDGLGDPRGALRDVAFIEAALRSGGQLVDI
jgi:predicted dehydrogenase